MQYDMMIRYMKQKDMIHYDIDVKPYDRNIYCKI